MQALYERNTILFELVFLFLSVPHSMQDLSSLIKDQTHAPCRGRTEFKPLDHQGSPEPFIFAFCTVVIFF